MIWVRKRLVCRPGPLTNSRTEWRDGGFTRRIHSRKFWILSQGSLFLSCKRRTGSSIKHPKHRHKIFGSCPVDKTEPSMRHTQKKLELHKTKFFNFISRIRIFKFDYCSGEKVVGDLLKTSLRIVGDYSIQFSLFK